MPRAKPDLQLATASAIRLALPQQPSCEIGFRFDSADFVADGEGHPESADAKRQTVLDGQKVAVVKLAH